MNHYNTTFKIGSRNIGLNFPTYFIADIAANHDGDLNRAKELIYLAAKVGADAAKFQHFSARTIVSDYGFRNLGEQKSHQSKWEKSVFEVYQDASLNVDWTSELKKTCEDSKIDFFTSPYSFELVDYVDEFVPAYKVGSGDITWLGIIEQMAKKSKPVFLACGASTLDEVYSAVSSVTRYNKDIVLMQCNTNYTGRLENFKYINLNVLNTFKAMFPGMILGLSDHTPGHSTVLGAIALGARVVEKHFTDDVNRDGPDHGFSMDPVTWKDMIDRSRELEFSLGSGVKKVEENESDTIVLQRRSIRAAKEIPDGKEINREDVEFLRPAPVDGIPPYKINEVIGKKTNKKILFGEHIRWSDLI